MPFNIFGPRTTVESIIRERGNDVATIAALEARIAALEARGLAGLPDVTISAPVNGDVLTYNGTVWENQ